MQCLWSIDFSSQMFSLYLLQPSLYFSRGGSSSVSNQLSVYAGVAILLVV